MLVNIHVSLSDSMSRSHRNCLNGSSTAFNQGKKVMTCLAFYCNLHLIWFECIFMLFMRVMSRLTDDCKLLIIVIILYEITKKWIESPLTEETHFTLHIAYPDTILLEICLFWDERICHEHKEGTFPVFSFYFFFVYLHTCIATLCFLGVHTSKVQPL